jgi:tRNA-dihydrouridine synthase B
LFIGGLEINTKLALAPMAGVTDLAFRTICREQGAGLSFTEMVSAKALMYQDSKSIELLRLAPDEHPAGVQIFGSDPSCMAEAAQKAVEISGADIVDINMGCPVPKIVKSGDGAALMRDVEKAVRIAEAVVKHSSVPVTAKIRKGWDRGSVNAPEFALALQNAGISAITVHGRTRSQMYSGQADWEIIKRVAQMVSIPVIANGDIFTGRDALRILEYTGAQIAMIGRIAFGNPWIFAEARAALDGLPEPSKPPLSERCDTAMRQFYMAAELKGERVAVLEARRHYAWYLKGVAYAGYYKARIMEATTLKELEDITKGIKRDLR